MAILAQDSATYFGGFLVTAVINMVIWTAARVSPSSAFACSRVTTPLGQCLSAVADCRRRWVRLSRSLLTTPVSAVFQPNHSCPLARRVSDAGAFHVPLLALQRVDLDVLQLNIHQAVQSTYPGHTSAFGSTFVMTELQFRLRAPPRRSRSLDSSRSDDEIESVINLRT